MCPKSLEGIEFFVTEENKPLCKEDFARYVIIALSNNFYAI